MTLVKKIKVAAYIRVSTDEQAKSGFGLDTQLRQIKSEVERNKGKGWELNKEFIYKDDGYSGSLKSRPALNRFMRDAKAKKFDLLLTWKIDRLFRNTRLLLETMDTLGEYGIDYKSVTEPFDTTAVGRFIFQMFGALAEFERNLILTRTVEGKISSSKEGNFVGGSPPYGYTTVNKKLTILKDEAKIVRKIYVWFVELDYTVNKIAGKLTSMKVPGKFDDKGKKSRRRTNPAYFWHGSTIESILKRPEYMGVYYYNKTGRDENKKW
jgi:site-specific DNA recombinase